jgi:hypothetical protein
MTIEQVFEQGSAGPGKADRIIALTERMQKIESSISCIKYDNDLLLEIPEALRVLGAAKDAVVAELKSL